MKGTFSDGIPAWYLLGTCRGDPQADRRRCKGCWNEPTKDVAAMANTRGGLIIYGVQDKTCELVGINPGDVSTEQYAQWVRERRRARRRPALVRGEADRLHRQPAQLLRQAPAGCLKTGAGGSSGPQGPVGRAVNLPRAGRERPQGSHSVAGSRGAHVHEALNRAY
ncbi:putative DNA binding domain-containing protein [Streptomyces europaeiscabiei]|uniref:AlbA family DNA-binding domain-containing protein n=1 Tax=Streptomyces europaeiscabiei TaxID=146819 RepID=UPI0029AC066F|nr:RNA-binding domain-containing protein [Streptomyces europaeiscabiei]MDX3697254.1 putative DNA binding domain-containing protein [Streptomyces europaeiscabiei]